MRAPGSRRSFLRLLGAGTTAAWTTACGRSQAAPKTAAGAQSESSTKNSIGGVIPKRPLGKTGLSVSILGLGGAHLGRAKDEDEAKQIVHQAIDAGVTFFDNAWEYNEGKSEEWLGKALVGKRNQVVLMTKVCTHGRDAKVAMEQLEQSLRRLKTDHLDVWQVHECIYDDEPTLHFMEGGVIEALARAKKEGKVRLVGFTGHKDPQIHLAMLSHQFPFDTCQMPLNAFDASFRSFARQVIPEATKQGIAVIGMKSLGGRADSVRKGIVTAEEALRYAMSLPVATTVTGVDSIDVLQQNLGVARGFSPMSAQESAALVARVAEHAADGHFELYKTSVFYDADVGRSEHGFPDKTELPY